jgi:hypothetical protein
MSEHLLARFRQHTLEANANRNVARALRESTAPIAKPTPGSNLWYTAADTSHARGCPFFPFIGGITGTMQGTDPMRDGAGIHSDDCTCPICRRPKH